MSDIPLDNPLLRFKTFWAVLGLMFVFAIVGVIFRWLDRPVEELDHAAAVQRAATLAEVRESGAKAVQALGLEYTAPQGGHLPKITVPDELIGKALEHLKANPAHKTEKVIPGTPTFNQQQATQAHDPTESEFLNAN